VPGVTATEMTLFDWAVENACWISVSV